MRTRSLKLAAAALALPLTLGGCGFHPLYASHGGAISAAQSQLGAIEVAIIPDRAGQLLRQALQAELGGDGTAKRYELSVAYALNSEAIGIQRDSSATRVRLIGNATWTLRALTPQRPVVATGTARDLDGLNVIDNQYFALDLETSTVQKRIAEALARRIAEQLAIHFDHQNKVASAS